MPEIYGNILELIGKTPMVKLNKINDSEAEIYLKLEFFNPAHSIKDRAALKMIEEAEKLGKIDKNTVIIEPTSGNTGIGLALVCAVKGYKIILTMPESMSIERRKMLQGYGAELVLTPKEAGMKGAVDMALELAEKYESSFVPAQFSNPDNPKSHILTTAEEIWADTHGNIDIFVASFGTGGTISGVGKRLKELNPNIKIIAIEPKDSPLVSEGKAGPHGIQGIGANFIPKNLDMSVIDEVITAEEDESIETAKLLARKEGVLCGISSGANVSGALRIAKRAENKGKKIVTVITDYGERYLSTKLFD
ncbi:TPA: cysteine synthase A [Candidatus Spyradomonas excrementavium]|nr:cysteine synthase A [Candidatus Spyradomonas excrementavium]